MLIKPYHTTARLRAIAERLNRHGFKLDPQAEMGKRRQRVVVLDRYGTSVFLNWPNLEHWHNNYTDTLTQKHYKSYFASDQQPLTAENLQHGFFWIPDPTTTEQKGDNYDPVC